MLRQQKALWKQRTAVVAAACCLLMGTAVCVVLVAAPAYEDVSAASCSDAVLVVAAEVHVLVAGVP